MKNVNAISACAFLLVSIITSIGNMDHTRQSILAAAIVMAILSLKEDK